MPEGSEPQYVQGISDILSKDDHKQLMTHMADALPEHPGKAFLLQNVDKIAEFHHSKNANGLRDFLNQNATSFAAQDSDTVGGGLGPTVLAQRLNTAYAECRNYLAVGNGATTAGFRASESTSTAAAGDIALSRSLHPANLVAQSAQGISPKWEGVVDIAVAALGMTFDLIGARSAFKKSKLESAARGAAQKAQKEEDKGLNAGISHAVDTMSGDLTRLPRAGAPAVAQKVVKTKKAAGQTLEDVGDAIAHESSSSALSEEVLQAGVESGGGKLPEREPSDWREEGIGDFQKDFEKWVEKMGGEDYLKGEGMLEANIVETVGRPGSKVKQNFLLFFRKPDKAHRFLNHQLGVTAYIFPLREDGSVNYFWIPKIVTIPVKIRSTVTSMALFRIFVHLAGFMKNVILGLLHQMNWWDWITIAVPVLANFLAAFFTDGAWAVVKIVVDALSWEENIRLLARGVVQISCGCDLKDDNSIVAELLKA